MNLPGVANVNEYVFDVPASVPDFMPASDEKTVCGSSSVFRHVTVVPTFTLIVDGLNAKFVIVTFDDATAGALAAPAAGAMLAIGGIVVAGVFDVAPFAPPPHAASATDAKAMQPRTMIAGLRRVFARQFIL